MHKSCVFHLGAKQHFLCLSSMLCTYIIENKINYYQSGILMFHIHFQFKQNKLRSDLNTCTPPPYTHNIKRSLP